MNCEELESFLVDEEGVPDNVAQTLRKQNLNGRVFARLAASADRLRELAESENDLKGVLTGMIIADLVGLRDRVAERNREVEAAKKHGEGGGRPGVRPTSATPSNEEASMMHCPRDGPVTRQVERPFLNPHEDSKGYTWNNYIKNETGACTLEPSREFKRLDRSNFSNIEDAKDAFLERIYEFSFGCLNARLNGTLYFGVEDGHLNDTHHGAIRGNFLTSEEMNKLQEMLEVNLTRSDAKLLQGLPSDEIGAIVSSIKALQFIPVNKGVPKEELEKAHTGSNLFVIELDVEPASEWCGEFKFKLNVRRGGAKGKRKKAKKGTDQLREFTYFFRDGSQTVSFKESDQFGMKKIDRAIQARKHHEEMTFASLIDTDTSKRLVSTLSLKRSSGFPHKSIRYVLIHNDLEIPASSWEWVAKLDWFLILNFSEEISDEPYNSLKEAKIRLIPTIGIDELAKKANEEINDYLFSICGTSTTLHIDCVSKGGEEDNWQQCGGLGLTKLISLASNFDHTVMSDVVLIILLGSHRRLQFIAEAIKKFSEVLPMTHMACLHEKPNDAQVIMQQVEPFFGQLWRNQVFCINFPHLNNFLLKLMGQEIERKHLLPCSFGVSSIPQKSLDYFRDGGITVVPSDMCSNVNSFDDTADTDAFVENCQNDIEKYLKGTIPPPWILFYAAENMKNPGPVTNRLTKGLVYRDIMDDILNDIRKLETGTENIVVRLPIVHMPSAGATTIARHVLWCLKDDRRCIIIDGNHYKDMSRLQEVAESIITFRALGENDSSVVQGTHSHLTCPTVILLFDNCNQQMAKVLTKYVENKCEKQGIVSKSPILVIMCLYSMFKYQPENLDPFDVEKRNLIQIDRRLSYDERKRFSDKLEEIRNQRTTVEDLLSFVILAYANEEDSEVVRHVVNKTLTGMDKRETNLLEYLAILKYYSNGWLPNQLVLNYAFGQIIAEASTIKIKHRSANFFNNITQNYRVMSAQFESLVAVDDEMPNAFGGGSFWAQKNFVSISHASVAYNILKVLVPESKLAKTVEQMLSEKVIMDTYFQREHVHKVFRLLLTQRTINEKTHMKDQLSKVIEAIIRSENKERAVGVLECAYKVLDDGFNKAHIAQTIARIYLDCEGLWEGARTWANNAVEQTPTNFAIRDTLARVYLSKQLRHMENIRTKGIAYYVPEYPDVLNAWHNALTEFRRAQELYYKTKRGERRYSIVIDDEASEDDSEYGVTTNTPFGIVEANIKIMEFLLNSEDMAKDQKLKERFLGILMEADRSTDFSSLFSEGRGTPDFSWQPYHTDLVDIFNTTRDCLELLTRKLCYIDVSVTVPRSLIQTAQLQNASALRSGWMAKLAKQVESFRTIFGYKKDINSLDSANTTPKIKMRIARMILQSGQANSFGWLSRKGTKAWSEESKLKEYCKCLNKMIEASCVIDSPLIGWDKMSYVNVAFAYHLHSLRTIESQGLARKQKPILDYSVVKKYVAELVRSKVTSPDPYFFFTMIYFPNAKINESGQVSLQSLRDDEFINFIQCMMWLKDFKHKDFYCARPRYVFYLGPGDNQSMDRFLPGMGSGVESTPANRGRRLKLLGVLDENKDVLVKLEDESEDFQELKIKNVKPYQRNKPPSGGSSTQRVTFNLAFTYGGPVAIDVVSVEPDYERQRVLDSARRHQ